ncbi:MAG: alpha/beta hydrolase [Clostridia bacterium]|nr:alpha/beta hydrolase [Clostridia bacterium]
MKKEVFDLWTKVPGMCEEVPVITAYIPDEKKSDAAIVIYPGGGYSHRASHEGEGYAEFLCDKGITAFVVSYRVAPHRHPLPLADARRGIQFVRYHADKYGIKKDKIAVMGSSAGGHLAASASTYFDALDLDIEADDISAESYIPNAQILCYPVIMLYGKGKGHIGSGKNLLAENLSDLGEELSPNNIVNENTPQAFIWHTFEDGVVNVVNTLEYAKALKNAGKDCEVHIYPHGRHGLGICAPEDKLTTHVRQWADSLVTWLKYIDYIEK